MPRRDFWFEWSNSVAMSVGSNSRMPAEGSRFKRPASGGMKFLRERAIARWRTRCPCCTRPMSLRLHGISNGRTPKDYRTRGHDEPQGRGGDPDRWIYICHECNTDQGALTFAVWERKLRAIGDARAEHVALVARFFQEHAPCTNRYGDLSGPSRRASLPTTG